MTIKNPTLLAKMALFESEVDDALESAGYYMENEGMGLWTFVKN